MRSVKGFKLISQQLIKLWSFRRLHLTQMIWVRWCLLKSIMKKKFKNGISLITIPVPIVCVFQGCVISSCWYFAQALLRILITACLISLFFERWVLWSAGDRRRRRRHVFFISATERPWEGIWGGRGGDLLIFRRTEGGIISNWESQKEIIEEELEDLRRTTHICWTMPVWKHVK